MFDDIFYPVQMTADSRVDRVADAVVPDPVGDGESDRVPSASPIVGFLYL